MKKLDFSAFKPVELRDREILEPFIMARETRYCDYQFTGLYAWTRLYGTSWLLQENRLWLYSSLHKVAAMPLGADLAAPELAAVAGDLAAWDGCREIVMLDQAYLDRRPDTHDYFQVNPDPDNANYIYSSSKLVELSGKKLAKKKNLLNQFRRNHPGYRVLPVQKEDMGRVLELSRRWCLVKDCEEDEFRHEKCALARIMADFDRLDIAGIKIALGDEIIAFSLFSALNSNTIDVNFEKFAPDIKGSGQVINWETARYVSAKYPLINREQDLGQPGLRQAKRSYAPEFILIPYRLCLKC